MVCSCVAIVSCRWNDCDSCLRREITPMSFANVLDQLRSAGSPGLRRFAGLIEPSDNAQFEQLAQQARLLTRRNFGRTMRMFAPLYLSNECINNCRYCGILARTTRSCASRSRSSR